MFIALHNFVLFSALVMTKVLLAEILGERFIEFYRCASSVCARLLICTPRSSLYPALFGSSQTNTLNGNRTGHGLQWETSAAIVALDSTNFERFSLDKSEPFNNCTDDSMLDFIINHK